ncbi:hypothetical protein PMAYCL1PPCAC_08290, partial [Pristionchus mayeri]
DIKEEPVDQPINDFAEAKQKEDCADGVVALEHPAEIKEELVEVKNKPIVDFADLTHEAPSTNVADVRSGNIEELVEIKDEPIEFVEAKIEEPIMDMYCPSTGTSRPL